MGQQIAIAQDKPDEDAAMEFLRARGELLALPRYQETPTFKAVPAGRCDAQCQLLFLNTELDTLLATVHESSSKPGQFSVDFSVTSGLFIEWDRTLWREPDLAEAGRFYLARAKAQDNESIAALTRAMNALQRSIRSHYPARSGGRYPVYVGPAMWERVEKDKARILSSAGEELKPVKNG